MLLFASLGTGFWFKLTSPYTSQMTSGLKHLGNNNWSIAGWMWMKTPLVEQCIKPNCFDALHAQVLLLRTCVGTDKAKLDKTMMGIPVNDYYPNVSTCSFSCLTPWFECRGLLP